MIFKEWQRRKMKTIEREIRANLTSKYKNPKTFGGFLLLKNCIFMQSLVFSFWTKKLRRKVRTLESEILISPQIQFFCSVQMDFFFSKSIFYTVSDQCCPEDNADCIKRQIFKQKSKRG